MNPLRRIDTWFRTHPVISDVLVACLLLLTFSSLSIGAAAPIGAPDVNGLPWVLLAFTISVGQLAPWAIRRWKPVLAAGLTVFFCLVQLLIGPELLPSIIIVPMMVHNLAVNAPRWASLAGIGTALAGAVLNGVKIAYFPRSFLDPSAALVENPDIYTTPTEQVVVASSFAVGAASIVLAAWAFGDLARTRRLAMEQLRDRARQLEVEAAQERELAAADERNHIAREMHDIVAHSLQVIITQADGGRYAGAQDPQVAVDTLGTVSETGRKALGEMRRLLGVLRGPEATEFHPQPGLVDLEDLVETIRLTGLDVDFAVEGEARRALPTGGELAAYRAVQESLTNTVRHGGPNATATVRLRWTGRGLEIEVQDNGRGAAASEATAGSRQGLVGLRERIGLFGGSVRSGPRQGGGFAVHATVPYQEI
ncbi:sensor histidine kinase [Citricoccus sp. I39-566]|uniref:sensor histidine kinase n=1 Tax=Citricoccus sp. I39-566 TaxID=3073268 RepID=UPI00286BF0D4|nr:sensor histidine kinase [Citricoccus sp. I39-566]WMY78700.1 sensor histidine kinase [Citricoccus sp. I39-566]